MLCEACQAIFKTSTLGGHQYHHYTFAAFVAAATSGCQICRRVWDKISPEHRTVLLASTRKCGYNTYSFTADEGLFGLMLFVFCEVIGDLVCEQFRLVPDLRSGSPPEQVCG